MSIKEVVSLGLSHWFSCWKAGSDFYSKFEEEKHLKGVLLSFTLVLRLISQLRMGNSAGHSHLWIEKQMCGFSSFQLSLFLKLHSLSYCFRCVIAELFLEGQPLFELSQLLAYRRGQYDPSQHLEKVLSLSLPPDL